VCRVCHVLGNLNGAILIVCRVCHVLGGGIHGHFLIVRGVEMPLILCVVCVMCVIYAGQLSMARYRALLQKSPIILRSLLIVATPYKYI